MANLTLKLNTSEGVRYPACLDQAPGSLTSKIIAAYRLALEDDAQERPRWHFRGRQRPTRVHVEHVDKGVRNFINAETGDAQRGPLLSSDWGYADDLPVGMFVYPDTSFHGDEGKVCVAMPSDGFECVISIPPRVATLLYHRNPVHLQHFSEQIVLAWDAGLDGKSLGYVPVADARLPLGCFLWARRRRGALRGIVIKSVPQQQDQAQDEVSQEQRPVHHYPEPRRVHFQPEKTLQRKSPTPGTSQSQGPAVPLRRSSRKPKPKIFHSLGARSPSPPVNPKHRRQLAGRGNLRIKIKLARSKAAANGPPAPAARNVRESRQASDATESDDDLYAIQSRFDYGDAKGMGIPGSGYVFQARYTHDGDPNSRPRSVTPDLSGLNSDDSFWDTWTPDGEPSPFRNGADPNAFFTPESPFRDFHDLDESQSPDNVPEFDELDDSDIEDADDADEFDELDELDEVDE